MKISAEQINTLDRAIRLGEKVLISRDGSTRPLYPTAHRVRLHPRVRIANAPTPLLTADRQDEVEARPITIRPTTNDLQNDSIFEFIKSVAWKTSKAVASGAAWISMAHGMRTGRMSTSASGFCMFVLMGGSELADYPIGRTVRNDSAPFIQHACHITMGRLTEAADLATEGMLTSAKFVVWWLAGIVIIVFGSWLCLIWILEYLTNRTRSVGSRRKSSILQKRCVSRKCRNPYYQYEQPVCASSHQ